MRPATALRTLTWLLRLAGAIMLCATFAVVMPTDWMAQISDWLGVGPLQRSPLTEYLTRSLSALYAMLGAFTLYCARDIGRYLDLVRFAGWLTIALGVVLTILDFAIGMPPSWSWAEGPPTVLLGGVLLWLARASAAGTPAAARPGA